MYKLLFTPKKINQLELKSRIVMLPMHMSFADEANRVTDKDVAFYRARAKGGAALLIMPAAVSQRGMLHAMHGLWDDAFLPGLRRVADAVHAEDAKLFFQLFHCGRNGNAKTLGGLEPWAPSAIPSPIYKGMPVEMDHEQIRAVVSQFAQAAARAAAAGADGVEISATVGYIMAQFTSPLTNRRTDEYGGSEENRFRFPMEVVRAVRAAVGRDYPMGIRISGAQMMEGGYDVSCMCRFCRALDQEKLVDYISVTGGWHESPVPLVTYHVPAGGYAFLGDAIKRAVGVPVMMSNRINSGEVAEKLLQQGMLDFVGVARGFLADPAFANHTRDNEPVNICQGCNRGCIEAVFAQRPIECAFNPEVGREYLEAAYVPKHPGRSVLVIGGGPAGMEAAAKAAERGCRVTLATDEPVLGGQLNLACIPPRKQDIALFRDYMADRLRKLSVNVLLNTRVDEDFITAFKPELVAIATGSEPVIPDVPGVERAILASGALRASGEELAALRRGNTVIVGGGSTALDVAHHLVAADFAGPESQDFVNRYVTDAMGAMYVRSSVTCIKRTPKFGADLNSLRRLVLGELEAAGVRFKSDAALRAIDEDSVLVEGAQGEYRIPADNVILAMGMTPRVPDITGALDRMHIPYAILGDAEKPLNVMHALEDAYQWSLSL